LKTKNSPKVFVIAFEKMFFSPGSGSVKHFMLNQYQCHWKNENAYNVEPDFRQNELGNNTNKLSLEKELRQIAAQK